MNNNNSYNYLEEQNEWARRRVRNTKRAVDRKADFNFIYYTIIDCCFNKVSKLIAGFIP